MAKPSKTSLDMIRQLVEMPTVSRDSNLDLIYWILDHLNGMGVAATLVHDVTGKKANLYATLGPQDQPGIMLSGHTDVVPVDGQDRSEEQTSELTSLMRNPYAVFCL